MANYIKGEMCVCVWKLWQRGMGFVSTLAICVIAIVIVIGVVIIKNGLASEAGGFSKKNNLNS